MPPARPLLVAETDRIEVLFLPGSGDQLLITFNGLGDRADGKHISAQKVATNLGLPAIGFMSRQGNWFPRDDMARLMPELQPILSQFKTRIAYGFSMGGYGAVKFSGMLGATHVMALSPQWSIDPAVAPWEQRYLKFLEPQHQTMQIVGDDCHGVIYLIYDPLDLDRHHADRIRQATFAHPIHTPFTGHDTWRLFLSTATMSTMLSALLASDVQTLSKLARQRRRTLSDFKSRLLWGRVKKCLADRRLGEAERVAAYVDGLPNRVPGAAHLLSAVMLAQGRPKDAEAVVRREMEHYPNMRWLALSLSNALEAQGRYTEALHAISTLQQFQPKRVDLKAVQQRLNKKALEAQAGLVHQSGT